MAAMVPGWVGRDERGVGWEFSVGVEESFRAARLQSNWWMIRLQMAIAAKESMP